MLDSPPIHHYFTRFQQRRGAMDPNTKLILDEMEKRFAALDLKWEQQFTEFAHRKEERLGGVEAATFDLEQWRPKVDSAMEDVKLELRKLGKQFDRVALESSTTEPGLLAKPDVGGSRPCANKPIDGPFGHRDDLCYRDQGPGSFTTLLPGPVKGTHYTTLPAVPVRYHGHLYDEYLARHRFAESGSRSIGKLPQLSFPSFDGDNPRLWISRCEKYFDMYSVELESWVKVATMHLSPPVACWFQSVEMQYQYVSWPLFCELLHGRYGRDQHQSLLRLLFRIRQDGKVAEYIEKFSTLVDQLSAYERVSDPLYFATRFVEGLRPDIRAVVLIQRPADLDTACSLALLQEEVSEPLKRWEFSKSDYGARPSYRGVPAVSDRVVPSHIPEIKSAPALHQSAEDKFKALRAYRRAKGLCDRCAEKWSKGHTCSTTVHLHAMQEVLELFSVEDIPDGDLAAEIVEESTCLALSSEALKGGMVKRALQLYGVMQHNNITILVDSGSTNSFISEQLVTKLDNTILVPVHIPVKVADGTIIQCSSLLSQATWSVQQCSFTQDLKVLPLSSYDVILGMDWLEQFSPMEVDWKFKWL